MCLPIGEEYSNQTNMRILVIIMFVFLFLYMAISILCFTAVYCESTPKEWIASQSAAQIRPLVLVGWEPDPLPSTL